MIKFLKFLSLFSLSYSLCFSQVTDKESFQSPLQIPLFLSGNFGELRATHFHAGLDFKTEGVTGKPVMAVKEGYVSRIKIQSGGYGHSLYISHPDGHTTVYAHLERYAPEIQAYVVQQQYLKRTYETELFPARDMFPVRKGQVVAWSGNTGRSGGPHLHFEIRRSYGQIPLNGLLFGFPVTDNISPEFRGLYIYTYQQKEPNGIQSDRKYHEIIRLGNASYGVAEPIELNAAYFGIGVEVYDFLNGSSNRCGVYSMELKVDGELMYGFKIDEIPFSDTRYVNAHMDYDLKISGGKSVHRLFALPNNNLSIYTTDTGNGIYALKDFNSHEAEIIARDAYGNKSSLSFSFVRKQNPVFSIIIPDLGYIVEWEKGRKLEKDSFSVEIPPKALYQDINMHFDVIRGNGDIKTDTFIVHSGTEPLHRNVNFSLVSARIVPGQADKLLFACIDEEGDPVAEGGEYIDGALRLSTRQFGVYMIVADTVPPEIKAVKFVNAARYTSDQEIVFVIADELSGIKSYAGYIDNEWALFCFDAKSGSLSYRIDGSRLSKGKTHSLRIEVSDNKENPAVFEGSFVY